MRRQTHKVDAIVHGVDEGLSLNLGLSLSALGRREIETSPWTDVGEKDFLGFRQICHFNQSCGDGCDRSPNSPMIVYDFVFSA